MQQNAVGRLGRAPKLVSLQSEIDLADWWVLGRPGLFLNTLADIHILPRVLDAAGRLPDQPPSAREMQQLVEAEDMATLFPVEA